MPKLLINAIQAPKQHHSFSHSLRFALPLLSLSTLLPQRIWSAIAAAAGTVRSACQTEIHVSGMSPRGIEQFSQIRSLKPFTVTQLPCSREEEWSAFVCCKCALQKPLLQNPSSGENSTDNRIYLC